MQHKAKFASFDNLMPNILMILTLDNKVSCETIDFLQGPLSHIFIQKRANSAKFKIRKLPHYQIIYIIMIIKALIRLSDKNVRKVQHVFSLSLALK